MVCIERHGPAPMTCQHNYITTSNSAPYTHQLLCIAPGKGLHGPLRKSQHTTPQTFSILRSKPTCCPVVQSRSLHGPRTLECGKLVLMLRCTIAILPRRVTDLVVGQHGEMVHGARDKFMTMPGFIGVWCPWPLVSLPYAKSRLTPSSHHCHLTYGC